MSVLCRWLDSMMTSPPRPPSPPDGPPAGHEFLAPEGHAAVAAVAGLDPDFGFINEHNSMFFSNLEPCPLPVTRNGPDLDCCHYKSIESRRFVLRAVIRMSHFRPHPVRGITSAFPIGSLQSLANSLQGKMARPESEDSRSGIGQLQICFRENRSNPCSTTRFLQPQAGCRIVARYWVKPLARAALLIMAGACVLFCAHAQQPAATGSLDGRLTDIRSAPLADVTVTLHNTRTGAQQQSKTSHSGRYHFDRLVEGEYTLTAEGPLGYGSVSGIYVAAGHQAQVQTAIEFAAPHPSFAAHPQEIHQPSQIASTSAVQLREWRATLPPSPAIHETAISMPAVSLASQALFTVPLPGTLTTQFESLTSPTSNSIAAKPLAAAQIESASPSSQSLDAAQVQALPLARRDWRNFVLDAPAQNAPSNGRPAHARVRGSCTRYHRRWSAHSTGIRQHRSRAGTDSHVDADEPGIG